ncbi:fumarylacetoacetate hydrolase family protein [Amycolatopsis endophytica]|uniref:2-keto-4-pentenoate hydratase/2-oxohepta-3-ene-1,7-dioic acid hydratase in catechol pathway n=1 Tax=Amycolatopsis endophytica TaxID=860233 RepID=A0A853AX75_9PSEU|nr:fumarylacetoacetate hydrolase family protein [Amycolatopsis endophytica]NYI87290.1 2-keto-4-pentenoate hydratase/2-oxohepta-3-ene-1,7-dioic acid hydratase in catechol pathway [Amycolatopsis endophytica]
MHLYRTSRGLARRDGDDLLLLDLPYPDVAALCRAGVDQASTAPVLARVMVDEVELLAPVERPCRIVVVGLNYRSHAAETGAEIPAEPTYFCVDGGPTAGPGDPIVLPPAAPDFVDYEGEVGVVIGRAAYRVPVGEAWKFVGGLTCVNDVSARDLQAAAFGEPGSPGLGLSKALDTFKPLGPAVVTTDSFSSPLDLRVTTSVNGEIRQRSSTADLIFDIPQLVSTISRMVTLLPGDVICTGTPSGVGAATGRFLRSGDVVEVDVEGIGTLRNHVVDYQPVTTPS